MGKFPRAPLVLYCVLLTGCLARFLYSGDGKMIDNGPLAPNERYIVDLGQIDLAKREQPSFRIANLPTVRFFVCGLELQAPAGSHFELGVKEIDASVSIVVVSESGEVVARAEGPLPKWTWSLPQLTGATTAFLYSGGGVKTPPGLDSFFAPVRGESYRVEVTLNEPDSKSGITARLKLKGGGWK